ncbi:MAG TPA: peptidase U32 family protein [Saprospiraceae bacterium]|nr:peptidase U32 family protein [Saprospiraceae bacterium]HRP85627.1 peptidase U32 family protein [Saprospiraceae bacterium]
MSKIELLAPAGSFESLMAAIHAGADAVYFGVAQLNMRAKSINSFRIDDLEEIGTICRAHRVKTCLTLNTVMYDYDMQLIRTILNEVKKHGINAVIASDFAVIEMCRSMNIPLHISTQANVSNVEAARFFAPFSDVIVLARELTLQQVKAITAAIEREDIRGVSGHRLRIEIFAHGALCMAVSGKCYLSLHEQNASANRGACTQNCRRPYKVIDMETGNELEIDNEYIMSPKDLCTIDILDQVADSGASIIKIEGRGKSADYVYTVTSCYREALQALEDGTYDEPKVKDWMSRLEKVYNRGYWEGYYLGRKLGEWTKNPGSAATERKVYIGKSTNFFSKINVAQFEIETGKLKAGDKLLVMGRNFGVHELSFDDVRVNGVEAHEAKRGDMLTFQMGYKTTVTDKLYKLVPTQDA